MTDWSPVPTAPLTLVASMERDGHQGLGTARASLDGLIDLHSEYRERILIAIARNG
jgi:hypothetical protein